jgi:NADH dehydrogenase
MTPRDAVTGAFGYSGRAITTRLLQQGRRVVTLTGHSQRANPFETAIERVAFNFDDPDALRRSLDGVDTLYDTYWIRFDRGGSTHDLAVGNGRTLITAAAEAGVRRIVHVSVTNPDVASPLSYFAGKARLEDAVRESGMSYAILRPAVFFGRGDVLVNNIAWFLRHLPVFGIPGDGRYRLQPTFIDDFADLAVGLGSQTENTVVDAVGPEVFTFEELVRLLRSAVGSRAAILNLSPRVAQAATGLIGRALGDVILTRDEVAGLMGDLLVSGQAPTCDTRLTDWIRAEGRGLGERYASEVRRHYVVTPHYKGAAA